MFSGTLSDGTTTIPLYEAQQERVNVQEQGTPTASILSKSTDLPLSYANSFMDSGDGSHGWVLVLRSDLDTLDLNATYSLTFTTDSPAVSSMTWKGLVVCREPQAVTPSYIAEDEDGVCLVELSDARWLVNNPHFTQSVSKMYSVSSNASNGAGGPTVYLSTSLDGSTITGATDAGPIVITSAAHGLETGDEVTITGILGNTAANDTWTITVIDADTFSLDTSLGNGLYTSGGNWAAAWSWENMVGDLWAVMSGQLGAYPGLPFDPDGKPVGWIFQGKSAWSSLCKVLARVGCEVSPDLTQDVGEQFSIVQIGAEDEEADAILAAAEEADQKIHDAEFQTIIRGKISYGVRVFFHKQLESPTGIPPWLDNALYSVDIIGPDSSLAEPGIYHPIRDDLPAIYDDTDTLTNASALNDRAQERADDFYRMLRAEGGERLWKRYSGLLNIAPGSSLKGVVWRCVRSEGEDPGSGAYTDVVRHPPTAKHEGVSRDDYDNEGTLSDLVRVGFPINAGLPVCMSITHACSGETTHWDVIGGLWFPRTTPCPECGGSGSGPPDPPALCGDCNTVTTPYCTTLTGIVNTGGSTIGSACDCGTLALAMTMEREGTECLWETTGAFCRGAFSGGYYTAKFYFVPAGTYLPAVLIDLSTGYITTADSWVMELYVYLDPDQSGSHFWIADAAGWDCIEPLEMERITTETLLSGYCTGWPDTIEVEACGCDTFPTLTPSAAELAIDAPTISGTGTGLSTTPGDNIFTFNLGAVGICTACDGTNWEVTFTTNPLTEGTLEGSVSVDGCSSGAPVAVISVVENCRPVWFDSFTGADGTALTAHAPDLSPGGIGSYTTGGASLLIKGNTVRVGTGLERRNVFDSGHATGMGFVNVTLNPTLTDLDYFRLMPRDANVIVTLEYRTGTGLWTITISDMVLPTVSGTVTLATGTQYELTITNTATSVSASINGLTVTLNTLVGAGLTFWWLSGNNANADTIVLDNLSVVQIPCTDGGAGGGGGGGGSGLVGYWPMHEGSGATAHDLSGNNNHLTGFGSNYAWDADTPGAQAGTGGCVHMGAGLAFLCSSQSGLPTGTADRTVAFWYRLDAATNVNTSYGTPHYGDYSRDSSGTGIFGDDQQILNTSAPTDTAWHLFTMVWSGGTGWAYYEDGVAVSSGTAGFALNTSATGGIGIQGGGSGTAKMKDLRIYDSALSASDVASIFGGSFGP